MLRFDRVCVVCEDIDAVSEFFLALGFELEGSAEVEGDAVDKINGLDGVRAAVRMVRTPDGSGRLELAKYHTPADSADPQSMPANRLGLRHICIEVSGLKAIVDKLRADGYDTVGEVQDLDEYAYRLCYIRGPEGLIIELAEKLHPHGAS